MPKAYDEKSHDQASYHDRIGELDLELHQRFAEAKAVGDFLILATTQVGVGALFWVLLDRAKHSEIAVKPALGLLATGLLGLYLFLRVNRIVELFVLSAFLRVEQLFGVEYPGHERHVVIRALGKAFIWTIQLVFIWGLGFAAAELIQEHIVK